MLKVTGHTADATTHEYPTLFEAAYRILDIAVQDGGCQVEDTHSGRIFAITHVADRLPRVTPTTTEHTPEELKVA